MTGQRHDVIPAKAGIPTDSMPGTAPHGPQPSLGDDLERLK